jgi:NADH:ubiquinone oxidoreductase subunit 6 (subunit J)
MLTGFGLGNTEILVGGVCLLGLFITVMLLPETRGQSLETISKEFVQAEALSSELPAA